MAVQFTYILKDNNKSKVVFSEILRQRMQHLGLSQVQLAEKFGVSQSAVSNWLKGTIPGSKTLWELSRFFDVPVDTLLGKGKSKQKEQLTNLSRGEEFTPQQRSLLRKCFQSIEGKCLALPERERQIYVRFLADLFLDHDTK
ncbi:MAG TPA: XRE family transcriptional regulator [Verrucomicrobiales bacterium]|nr:XRE family transcriptional regulator [Verrucomicrobiales bacterium]HIL69796.1 XRE family transcriptional regulator [Verrucomicrobiota bacterium]